MNKYVYEITASKNSGSGTIKINFNLEKNFSILTDGLPRSDHKKFMNSLLYFDSKDSKNFSVLKGSEFLKKAGFEVEMKYSPENDKRDRKPKNRDNKGTVIIAMEVYKSDKKKINDYCKKFGKTKREVFNSLLSGLK